MAYRIFEVPEYCQFLDTLGAAPEPIEGEEAQCIKFEVDDELLAVTFDIPGRSFHCQWSRGSRVLAEIFREGAVQLRVRSAGAARFISVEFETDSERGQLEVQTSPVFTLRDKLLLR
jgi:hypothetical protein